MLLKDCTSCSTYSVRGLDDQLVAKMNEVKPGLLVRIDDDLNVQLGKAVHPWLQSKAKETLKRAIALRSQRIIINSAYRTLAGQALLRSHYEYKRCGIRAASEPGRSNHNNANAIDIEDSTGWRDALHKSGWKWIGAFDPMHYDCLGCPDILNVSVLAFQKLWNEANPKNKLAEDGEMGMITLSRLRFAPVEGFAGIGIGRVLRLTDPFMVGDDVGELQMALRSHGIPVEKADKIFGRVVHEAVVAFQEKSGLLPDGVVGELTKAKLGIAS